MKKFKVGLIGHTGRGNYGHQLDLAFENNENTEIIALTDFDKKAVIELSKKLNINCYNSTAEMYESENLDVVVVAPRYTDVHYSLVKEALDQNCHVLCEKPFVQSLEQADELISLAKMKNLKIAVSLPFSHESRFYQVEKMIKNGLIGNIYKMEGVCKNDHRGGGEDFAILGPHFADMMIRFAGKPKSGYGIVSENGKSIVSTDFKEGNEGLGKIAGDSIFGFYEFDNGVIGTIQSKKLDILKRTDQPYYLMIYGEKGILMIKAPYADHSIWHYQAPFLDNTKNIKWVKIETEIVEKYGDYQKMVGRDLLESIDSNREPKCSAEDFRVVLEMLLTPYYSQLKKSNVIFPFPMDYTQISKEMKYGSS